MAETILLLILISAFAAFILYISVRRTAIPRKILVVTVLVFLIPIIFIINYRGKEKIKSDLVRLIHNSRPKDFREVYAVLFNNSMDSCVTPINFKDQVIPKIDCCIWMELKVCPKELNRMIGLKNYTKSSVYPNSNIFLNSFVDRPSWWRPQILGDTLTKYYIKFNQGNEQTLIFGDDSTHLFICDKAL